MQLLTNQPTNAQPVDLGFVVQCDAIWYGMLLFAQFG